MKHKYAILLLITWGITTPLYSFLSKDVGLSHRFTWHGYDWYKWDGHDTLINNYFDPTLVFVDDSGFLHLKIYRDTFLEHFYYAAGIITANGFGPVGTYKFVFTYPNFTIDGDSILSYSPDVTSGPFFYTFEPHTTTITSYDTIICLPRREDDTISRSVEDPVLGDTIIDTITTTIYTTFEYDDPEMYGYITDTFGHFNFYKDSTIIEKHYLGDTIIRTIRLHTYHNTYSWSFSDPEQRGNGITTAWLSVFDDSLIYSIERTVNWEDGDVVHIHHIEHSVVIKGDSFREYFYPDTHLYPEVYIWWVRHHSNDTTSTHHWLGPDTLEMIVRDFSYSPIPVDPRKGDFLITFHRQAGIQTGECTKVKNTLQNTRVISYIVKNPQKVYLKLYNISGRVIKNEFLGLKTPGQYTVRLNLSRLPEGVYFVEITGKTPLTRDKIIVIH